MVLADEPTGNLDCKTTSKIVALLRTLNREKGTAIFIITH